MTITKRQEDVLIGRLLQCLKKVYEPVGAIYYRKGKNFSKGGIEINENSGPLDPEKFYGYEVPELLRVNHTLRIKMIIGESKDLEDLHNWIMEYYQEYGKPTAEPFKYPAALLPNRLVADAESDTRDGEQRSEP